MIKKIEFKNLPKDQSKLLKIFGSIFAIVLIIFGSIILFSKDGSKDFGDSVATTENGTQIITINVKNNGYSPNFIIAKAGIETIIRFKSKNSFSCGNSVEVPSFNFAKNLKPTDTYDMKIPPQKSGEIVKGRCSMGMYFFEVRFE
ncbi:MAG: hypothetical protein Fur0024_1690 [Patescibacteria group bacterium]